MLNRELILILTTFLIVGVGFAFWQGYGVESRRKEFSVVSLVVGDSRKEEYIVLYEDKDFYIASRYEKTSCEGESCVKIFNKEQSYILKGGTAVRKASFTRVEREEE
ncbi:MAG: hypothetical protein Q3993_05220 [Filifactor alocis]|nr:hypothetical protein [Filifactor alocis]